MRKPRPQDAAQLAAGTADDIEAAFYDALRTADLERLMACWADEDEIVCVHPGGSRCVGPHAIRAAFEAMFSGGGTVRAWPERVRRLEAVAASVHHLVERIEVLTPAGPQNAWAVATNVYVKTLLGWRMVAHHASPGSAAEVETAADTPTVLH